jgi:hypothetical protein
MPPHLQPRVLVHKNDKIWMNVGEVGEQLLQEAVATGVDGAVGKEDAL